MAEQGGRAKRLEDDSPGPWMRWPASLSRADRAIRFISEYCIPASGYGAGEPLQLAPFQVEWLEEVIGTGIRAAVLSLPRGNGKSTLLGGLATWATFDPDESGAPQVPVIAATVGQAIRTTYGAALAMVESNPELSRRAKVYTATSSTKIVVPSTRGEMFPVADYPDGLQGLNPSLAIADEVGFLSIESWNSLFLASGKRPSSLIAGIGTPGFDRDSALWALRQAWLEGQAQRGFLYREFAAPEGCDVHDESAWYVANPALAAGFMDIEALRMAADLPPESHFRIFRLGQWVEGVESWLGPGGGQLWESLTRRRELVPGAPTWVGVDVGLKRDSTGVVAVQAFDGEFHAAARIWTPGEDQPVEIDEVMAHIRELARAYDVQAVSFDARFFDYPAKLLADEGIAMIEIPQSIERMTMACGRALELIRAHRVTHGPDALFGQHVLNAVPRLSERGFTLAKAKAKGKIDACIALVLALDRAEQPPPAPRSPLVMSL